MSTSSELHQLIHSLSKQEKRYFKLYATFYTREGSNQYTRLFDAIDKTGSCDEQQLNVLLRQGGFSKHLASLKYQLTNLLLNSLAAFNAGKNVNAELRELLAHIEIVYNKGLYKSCRKLIGRARKKAESYERHAYLMEILAWERKLLFKNTQDTLDDEFQTHCAAVKSTSDYLHNTGQYLILMDTMKSIGRRFLNVPTADDREKLEDIRASPWLQSPERASTFQAQIARAETLGGYYWMMGELEEALVHYREAVAIWESNEQQLRDTPDAYRQYLSNYLNCCLALRRFDDFQQALVKIKELPCNSFAAEINKFEIEYYLELMYHLNEGSLTQGQSVAERIVEGRAAFWDKIQPNRLITICYNCSILYFLLGNFSKALELISAILDRSDMEPRQDIQVFTRVFQLIIHYELQHFDALEHMFRSTYRYLHKHSQFSNYESLVVNAVRKLVNSADKESSDKTLAFLFNGLIDILHEEDRREPLGIMEILFWTDARRQKQAIADVFSARMREGKELSKTGLFTLDDKIPV